MKMSTAFSPVPVVRANRVVEKCRICNDDWNVYQSSNKAYVCPKCTKNYVRRPGGGNSGK